MSLSVNPFSRRVLASSFFATLLTGAALAHTPYILPNEFSTSSARLVTAQASFAETFFQPDVAINSDFFHVIHPDGHRDDFDTHAAFQQVVILEETLSAEGTYRLSTGPRAGRKFPMRKVGDTWAYLERGDDGQFIQPEAGVETTEFQTLTVAEAYVTKGAPSEAALAVLGEGLEIHPLTHPSEIYLDEEFELKILFNGIPIPGVEFSLYRADGKYEDPNFRQKHTTNDQGQAALSFADAGIYLVMLRYRAKAPTDAETPYRSYTTSLTFEVVR
jgi:hypothetical protein